MSDGLGYYRPHDARDGCHHVTDAHEETRETRGDVQVIDVESCQTAALKANGNCQKRNCWNNSGSKIATQQEKQSSTESS